MPSMKELKERGDIPPPLEKIDKDGKEAWAKQGVTFDVLAVEAHPEGEKGPYHTYTVQMLDETVMFDLQDKGGRGKTAEAIAKMCENEPVTGCKLVALSKRAGNSFLVVEEA